MTTDLVPIGITEKRLLLSLAEKCFFCWKKRTFCQKERLLAKSKNSHFSVIPAGTRSVVIVGHFFYGPDGPTKFGSRRFKIKGTYNSEVGIARNGQKPPPQKKGFLAQKQPNLAQNWQYRPNIGIFGPFDPMPNQKTMQTRCLGGF